MKLCIVNNNKSVSKQSFLFFSKFNFILFILELNLFKRVIVGEGIMCLSITQTEIAQFFNSIYMYVIQHFFVVGIFVIWQKEKKKKENVVVDR